jgi:hypothetical protein
MSNNSSNHTRTYTRHSSGAWKAHFYSAAARRRESFSQQALMVTPTTAAAAEQHHQQQPHHHLQQYAPAVALQALPEPLRNRWKNSAEIMSSAVLSAAFGEHVQSYLCYESYRFLAEAMNYTSTVYESPQEQVCLHTYTSQH